MTSTAASLEQKKSYLDILAVFHYVNGGLAAVATLAALAFLGIGMGAASNWGRHFEPEPTCALVAIMFLVLVVAGGYAILNLLAGRAIQARKNRALILVTAAINCVNVPLGTLLGIFTFVLMVDPQVEWLFRYGDDATYAAPAEPYADPNHAAPNAGEPPHSDGA